MSHYVVGHKIVLDLPTLKREKKKFKNSLNNSLMWKK